MPGRTGNGRARSPKSKATKTRTRSGRGTTAKTKARTSRTRATTSRATTPTRARTAASARSTGGRRPASRRTLQQRTCEEVMSRDPLTLSEGETVFTTARVMRENNIGDVIVLDSGEHVKGIVTDRDVVVRAVAEGRDPSETSVGSICSENLTVVAPGDTVDRAVELMRERALRRLPVVEEGRVCGIISIGDLAGEFDERSALADISTAPPNI